MRHAAEKPEVPKLLPVSVAILDRSGTIVGVNDAWKDFARRSGLKIPDFGIGASYLHYCGSERSGSLQLADELRDLLAGRRDLLTRIYPCHSPTERRWFFMLGLPLSSGRRSGVALLHVNLTPLLTLSILTGEFSNRYTWDDRFELFGWQRRILKPGGAFLAAVGDGDGRWSATVGPLNKESRENFFSSFSQQKTVGSSWANGGRQDQC